MNWTGIPPRLIRFRDKRIWQLPADDQGTDQVTTVAHERWDAGFCARHENPGRFGAFQVLHGRGWFHDEQRRRSLAVGSVVWFGPDRPRAFWCDSGDPLEVIIVHADGPGWPAAAQHCLGRASGAWSLRDPQPALGLLQEIERFAARAHPDSAAQLAHLLHAWLYQLRHERLSIAPTDAAQSLWWRSRQLLQQGRVTSITELAGRLGVSVSYLARLYRRHDSRSPSAWLQEHRLQAAQLALVDSDQPIASIALEAGFADQSAFGKAFRRHLGTTPAAYRRRNRR